MKFLHVSGCLKVLKLHAMMNRGLLSRNPRILGVLLLVSCALAILYVMKWNLLRIESRMLRNTPTNTEATYLSQGSKGPDGTVGVQAGSGKSSGPPDVQSYQVILQQQEEKHRLEISTLKVQISQLQDALQQCNQPQVQETKSQEVDLEGFLQNQLSKAEVHTGSRVSSEYAVAPFQSFTLQSVYQLGSGLSRQPAEWPPQKDRRDELVGVVDAALSSLNTPSSQQDSTAKKTQQSKVYSKSDFVEGITRTEKDKGTLYELTFRGESSNDFRRLTLFRPFGPLMNVKNERVNKANVPINIVVPLSKRTDKFERFLNNFKEVGVGQDGHVHLTVVYFGKEQINETRRALENMAREANFKNYTLLHRDEVFSRGRALDVGARAWTGGDVLLFFCDVDVYFTADFLNTCRLNSEPGKKVFYPVLFSQYNPTLIYGSPQRIPALKQQLVIKTDTGFWRDFGFGMTCLYRSDYTKSGGFNLNIKGWGGEDVQLYRKFINSNIIVVRVPSRGLFHLWHEKICTRDLPSGQYNSCLRSKALIEASYDKLAMLNLQHQMEKNKQ